MNVGTMRVTSDLTDLSSTQGIGLKMVETISWYDKRSTTFRR